MLQNSKFIKFKYINKMVNRVLLYLILCFAILNNYTYSQSYQNISLDELVKIALENNLSIKSKSLDKKYYEAQVDEVIASGLPQINLSTNIDNNLIIPTTLIPAEIAGGPVGQFVPVQFGTQFNMSATASVDQLLYSHSFWVGLRASKAATELADITTNISKEQIIYTTSILYYNINITQKAADNISANIKKLKETVEIMQVQEANGLINKIDVKRVKVSITNLESELNNLKTAVDNLNNNLKVLLNLPTDTELTLNNNINEEQILEMVQNDINPYSSRNDLLLLNKQTELYELQKDNISAGYYPVVNAYGRYSYQAFRQSFDFFDTSKDWFRSAVIGVSIKIPIFDGLTKMRKSEQTEIKIAQTNYEFQLLKDNVNAEIKNAKTKLKSSLEQFNAQKENVMIAEEVFAQTELKYKEGVTPLTELLNSETSLKESQNNYLRALLQINISKLELKKAQGVLLVIN